MTRSWTNDVAYRSEYGLPPCLKGVGGAPIAEEIIEAITGPEASTTTMQLVPR